MPTWKKVSDRKTKEYCHLCSKCSDKMAGGLIAEGWELVRDGEPAECSRCVQQCTLTQKGLWGEPDEVRRTVCRQCAEYQDCDLKGEYYC